MAKSSNSFPAWLRWLFVAFVVYAGYQHYIHRDDPASVAMPSASASRPAEIVGSLPQGIGVGGDIAGSGDVAVCGQTATLEVSGSHADGTPLALASVSTIPVGLPQGDAPWAPAVTGMKQGGVREVALSGSMLSKGAAGALHVGEDEKLRYKIELKTLSPTPVPGHLPFLASDLVLGNGAVARCGDRVRVHVQLWNPDGSPGVSTRAGGGAPLELTLGEAAQFYGLDRGVMTMRVGGKRSLIVPPAYLRSAKGGLPADPRFAGWKADRATIADVELLEIIDKAKKTP